MLITRTRTESADRGGQKYESGAGTARSKTIGSLELGWAPHLDNLSNERDVQKILVVELVMLKLLLECTHGEHTGIWISFKIFSRLSQVKPAEPANQLTLRLPIPPSLPSPLCKASSNLDSHRSHLPRYPQRHFKAHRGHKTHLATPYLAALPCLLTLPYHAWLNNIPDVQIRRATLHGPAQRWPGRQPHFVAYAPILPPGRKSSVHSKLGETDRRPEARTSLFVKK